MATGRRCLPEQARHQVAKNKIGLDISTAAAGPQRGMISGVFKLAEFARLGSKLAPIFPAVEIDVVFWFRGIDVRRNEGNGFCPLHSEISALKDCVSKILL